MPEIDLSPYTMEEQPTSAGRALLARAFSHWCCLHHGYSPEEIAAAFDESNGSACVANGVKREVADAARLIGELIAGGQMRTYARRIGGGNPEPLPATAWELDDFRPRLARSAIDPERPFDGDADPTHWVFVDLEDFNNLVEMSCADISHAARTPSKMSTSMEALPAIAPSEDRHVRLPELMRRTGMSRSTIYRRIKQDRFPAAIPMDGNIASWWESEVAEWIANPR